MIEAVTKSHDGFSIRYAYQRAEEKKPWIVFVIPFGLRLTIAAPFFDFFGSHYNIVTWESRLILDENDANTEGDLQIFSVDNHVSDMLAVMDACGIRRANLVGYCSGAGIALTAVNSAPKRFTNLVLAHGEYTLLDKASCSTPFSRDIDSILTMAANNARHAEKAFEKIKSDRFEANEGIPEGMYVPYSELNWFRRYAFNYLAYKATDFEELAAAVGHFTYLLTGLQDAQANADSTRRIANAIKDSRLYIDATGDHYGMVRPESKTMIAVWNYLGERYEQAA